MKAILKQNSQGLYREIQATGCFFVSCLAIAQMKADKTLSKEQYNALYKKAHVFGFMKNGYMLVSDKVINLAFAELGVNKKAYEVGTDSGGFYGWVQKNKSYQRTDACIQKIKQPQGSVYPFHFRVTDKNGVLIFDPYEPEIKSAGSKHIIIRYCIKDI
ncbi:MAG: hypothetical protein P1P67_11845 [Treponema phagedenis]|uniref:hypothetical protein n=1 Tax=Treponema phagedenis TaxID=162 RepID=UPI003133D731